MGDPDVLSCSRFRISGRVQGVFFRASTRDIAVGLSLTGYAKNLPDGDVEVLACGKTDALEELAGWLRQGPRMASVARVDIETVAYREVAGFSIR